METDITAPSLQEWFNSRSNSLFDLKLFVAPDQDVSTRERSEEVLTLLSDWEAGKFVDITDTPDTPAPAI